VRGGGTGEGGAARVRAARRLSGVPRREAARFAKGTHMNEAIVTIIGLGPRGLSILERISHLARRNGAPLRLHVHLVDPGECGQGTHRAGQPPHLLVNTVSSQVTIFPPDTPAPPPPRP